MKTFFRRFWKLMLGGVIILTALLLGSDYWIKKQAKEQLYNEIAIIPHSTAGVVLGTSKRVRGGAVNLYFKYRMEAAAELYNQEKINFIIVSGDNSIMEYNETRDMKEALIKMGVPEEKIIEDFAGFRTLDSVIRAKEVFGQDSITVISQKFHNERALFIAKNNDIYALGFNAREVPKAYGTITQTREYFARVKAMLDIYILGTMPKYYKDKEQFPNEE